jgi:hypothetical protein
MNSSGTGLAARASPEQPSDAPGFLGDPCHPPTTALRFAGIAGNPIRIWRGKKINGSCGDRACAGGARTITRARCEIQVCCGSSLLWFNFVETSSVAFEVFRHSLASVFLAKES